jgi:CheY-like chemotaxis protein
MPPPRRHILCADDHEQIAMLMKRLLERAGHHVESVTDGQEAWKRLSADPTSYDFVVTDHQMPNLSGLQLVEKLRATGFAGKIIIQTCQLSPPEENAFRALAVDRILRKPGELLRLVEIVKTGS